MDPENAFLRAAFPEPLTLLGLQLRPYSIGHEIILRRFDSPFLHGTRGAQVSPDQLLPKLFIAVFVCSLRWAEAHDSLRDPDLEKTFAKWRNKLGRFEASEKVKLFTDYIAEAHRQPEFRRLRKKGMELRNLNAPSTAILLASALEHTHSMQEAFDMPFGLALWLHCVAQEQAGTISMKDQTEEDALKRMRADAERLGMTFIKASDLTEEERKLN